MTGRSQDIPIPSTKSVIWLLSSTASRNAALGVGPGASPPANASDFVGSLAMGASGNPNYRPQLGPESGTEVLALTYPESLRREVQQWQELPAFLTGTFREDLDGRPIEIAEAKAIVTERYTVAETVRGSRRVNRIQASV